MLRALEQIRRMRGGAVSPDALRRRLLYVVKFQNNPQHTRVLVNELLGTRLAARLGLPTVPVEIVAVSEELIRLTPELAIELPRARIPCQPGLQFGSRSPGDPRRLTLHDFLPDEQLRAVENVHAFAGILVFDKWTCNTNGRQTVFFSKGNRTAEQGAVRYETRMIDQGFCFNAGEWNPLRPGSNAWKNKPASAFSTRPAGKSPPEWYADDYDALLRLLEQLHRRRQRVPDLILEAKRCNRRPFPNWM